MTRTQTAASTEPLIGKAGADELHVMTFNIRMDDSAHTEPGEADHWPERRPLLMAVLEREQPTLLGVPEAKHSQLSALEQALAAWAAAATSTPPSSTTRPGSSCSPGTSSGSRTPRRSSVPPPGATR